MNKLGAFMNYGKNALIKLLASRGYRAEKAETKKRQPLISKESKSLTVIGKSIPSCCLTSVTTYIDVAARIEALLLLKARCPICTLGIMLARI